MGSLNHEFDSALVCYYCGRTAESLSVPGGGDPGNLECSERKAIGEAVVVRKAREPGTFWTKRLPEQAGHYWWRQSLEYNGRVVYFDGVNRVFVCGGVYLFGGYGGQWCGPLREPGGDAVENCSDEMGDNP